MNDARRDAEDVRPKTSVSVSRRIDVAPHVIFQVLTDPHQHVLLDGSGIVRAAATDMVVTGVGDVFTMKMHYPELGAHEMNNHIVEYERDRRISWEPEAGNGHPNAGTANARWGQRWIYELEPAAPDATLVTETYDCSQVPELEQARMNGGTTWIDAMTTSLQRLSDLCIRCPLS
jgi:Activator of Hsp90 ATPase homolog 1-like protein